MQIAICDDEDQERAYIESLVHRFAPELSIVCFSSADALLAATQGVFFPLIFLDIEMNNINGFEAAVKLMSTDAKPLIVFVTKSTEYTIRGYDVAFHYLVKPINEEKFHEVLNRALKLIVPQYFSFSADGELYRISLHEILYFESRNYTLLIHTQERIYKTRMSLKEVDPQLTSANFLRVHASFLINLHRVISITKDDVEMQDHQLIKISRSRRKEVLSSFTKFARENI